MIDIEPLTGTFGARLSNVVLAGRNEDSNETIDSIREALSTYKVVVIPGQQDLQPDELLRFAEHFGTAERDSHPTWGDVPGHIGVKLLATGHYPVGPDVGDSWHTDGPPRRKTQWFSFLHAIDVPPYGRDTLFADMEAAYQRVSPGLREFLEGLTALNSWGRQNPDAEPVEHPVIMVDPENGRKSLYVNRLYTRRIVGLRDEESDALLELLYRLTNVPELQLRVRWQRGTLTIWDNEKTQHYIVRDKQADRVMHRVMVNTGR